jgi:hypothetical protein
MKRSIFSIAALAFVAAAAFAMPAFGMAIARLRLTALHVASAAVRCVLTVAKVFAQACPPPAAIAGEKPQADAYLQRRDVRRGPQIESAWRLCPSI